MKERKIRVSEESKLFGLELKPCGAQRSCNSLPIKSSSANKCVHIEERESKPSIWIQQRASLIILDNGELNNSTLIHGCVKFIIICFELLFILRTV